MLKQHYSLRLIIPAGVGFIFLLILGLSIFYSIQQQQQRSLTDLEELTQRQIAQLSRHAERFLHTDPQVLAEEIGQLATTATIIQINIISPDGKILFSSDRELTHQAVKDIFPEKLNSLYHAAQQTRLALINYDKNTLQLDSFMSFSATDENKVRTLKRGVIYFAHDFSAIKQQATKRMLYDRTIELILLILGAIALVFTLTRLITKPLLKMAFLAKEVSYGTFTTHTNSSWLTEIHLLQDALNGMSTQLAHRVTQVTEQASQTQSIIDNMVDGLITIDKKGSMRSFNPAASKIFGYIEEEVIGKNVKTLMPSPYHEEHDGYLQHYQETRIAKIIGIGREVTGLRKNGEQFPMELAVSEVTLDNQVIYIGMVRDISERKQVERMKNEFISTVSHELRTPLTAITGALGLIKHGAVGAIPEQALSLIELANKNSQRLILLINDLLDMEKIIAGKMGLELITQPILPIIQQAIESNQTYGSAQEVSIALLNGDINPHVAVDNQRLIQVLSNLLSNAIKYSPDKSQVVVSLELLHSKVRVNVIDHGTGIPHEFQSRIFQKFTQADASDTRKKGGTGLGLAISKELITQMNGSINFNSTEGKGCCFYFELPIQH